MKNNYYFINGVPNHELSFFDNAEFYYSHKRLSSDSDLRRKISNEFLVEEKSSFSIEDATEHILNKENNFNNRLLDTSNFDLLKVELGEYKIEPFILSSPLYFLDVFDKTEGTLITEEWVKADIHDSCDDELKEIRESFLKRDNLKYVLSRVIACAPGIFNIVEREEISKNDFIKFSFNSLINYDDKDIEELQGKLLQSLNSNLRWYTSDPGFKEKINNIHESIKDLTVQHISLLLPFNYKYFLGTTDSLTEIKNKLYQVEGAKVEISSCDLNLIAEMQQLEPKVDAPPYLREMPSLEELEVKLTKTMNQVADKLRKDLEEKKSVDQDDDKTND